MQYYTSSFNTFDLDEEKFFALFPKRPADAYKGSNGKILLISGSYGMAGAACLNVLGAKALGAGYICVMLPENIYPIVASQNITPVFYPYEGQTNLEFMLDQLGKELSAAAFGSGAVRNPRKDNILKYLLSEDTEVPLVLDAEAINMLSERKFLLGKTPRPLIITPHLGEFCRFTGNASEAVNKDPVRAAADCAAKYGTITVLKGPRTVVASPSGRVYINSSGNQGLAQAGSGDLLTGMITAMLSFIEDPFEAACMGVFAHGLAADKLCEKHSFQCMPLEQIPEAMDQLFKAHGF